MGLVFIKINLVLKSPYTICHRAKIKKIGNENLISFFNLGIQMQ
jgi:hypothetical protein